MTKLIRIVLVLICASLVGCGSSSTTEGSSEGRAPSNADLDSVVERFGKAFATGDTETLAKLIDPNAPADLMATLEKLAPSRRRLELRDFKYEIVERAATTARVVYSGKECGPELSTSTSTEPRDGSSDSTESVPSAGTASSPATGTDPPLTCFDIAQSWAKIMPVEFVRSGDQWYGKYKISQ